MQKEDVNELLPADPSKEVIDVNSLKLEETQDEQVCRDFPFRITLV